MPMKFFTSKGSSPLKYYILCDLYTIDNVIYMYDIFVTRTTCWTLCRELMKFSSPVTRSRRTWSLFSGFTQLILSFAVCIMQTLIALPKSSEGAAAENTTPAAKSGNSQDKNYAHSMVSKITQISLEGDLFTVPCFTFQIKTFMTIYLLNLYFCNPYQALC